MTRIRLKFKKEKEAIFISHLDLMRTFQRAMRRAKLPLVYSGGFNPRPEMSFGQALSLGIESIGEYLDIAINDDSFDMIAIKDSLNNKLPQGIKVTDIALLNEKAKSSMSIVSHCRYLLNLRVKPENRDAVENAFQDFINQRNINVDKEKPKIKKIVSVDIKPLIKEVKLLEYGKGLQIDCIVSCGSSANLKPELIIKAFEDYLGFNIRDYKIKKIELFTEKNNVMIPLIEIDVV
ncbi:MAG: TIGR03936 family radical SAM-associated protein [Firmicutes bacterium]|nr:TIGR03936 family radical SAM-associated protein [Bacillota bacterium]